MKKEITPPSLIVAEKRVLVCINEFIYAYPHQLAMIFQHQRESKRQEEGSLSELMLISDVYQRVCQELAHNKYIKRKKEEKRGADYYYDAAESTSPAYFKYELTDKGRSYLEKLNISEIDRNAYIVNNMKIDFK